MERTKHNRIFLGIDPGSSSGGLAWIRTNGECGCTRFRDMTETELYWTIHHFTETSVVAMIEQVHAFPGQGVSSTFKFGANYGMLRGFLIAAGISFKEVTPVRWQKYYNLSKCKGETQAAWKRRLRQRAQELHPSTKISAETADAVLIAEYCKHNY